MNKPTIELDKMPKSCSECEINLSCKKYIGNFNKLEGRISAVYLESNILPQCPIIVPKTMDELRDEIIEKLNKEYIMFGEFYFDEDYQGFTSKNVNFIFNSKQGRIRNLHNVSISLAKLIIEYFDRLEEK